PTAGVWPDRWAAFGADFGPESARLWRMRPMNHRTSVPSNSSLDLRSGFAGPAGSAADREKRSVRDEQRIFLSPDTPDGRTHRGRGGGAGAGGTRLRRAAVAQRAQRPRGTGDHPGRGPVLTRGAGLPAAVDERGLADGQRQGGLRADADVARNGR